MWLATPAKRCSNVTPCDIVEQSALKRILQRLQELKVKVERHGQPTTSTRADTQSSRHDILDLLMQNQVKNQKTAAQIAKVLAQQSDKQKDVPTPPTPCGEMPHRQLANLLLLFLTNPPNIQGLHVMKLQGLLECERKQEPIPVPPGENIIKVDPFIARQFEIYRQTLQKGFSSPINIGVIRSDYMFLCGEEGVASLKQIEFNTVAVAGGGLASQLPAVHRHILKVAGIHDVNIMDNNCIAVMAGAIEKAWSLYGSQGSIVMFLVEDIQMNIYDQRLIENELWSRNIPVIRRRFEDISKRGHLDEEKRLFLDGQEVGLVYYRYGYLPQQYTEKSWEALLMMEQSRAVKCPNIGTHLVGIKKVQQELARPGVLEHFFPGDPEAVSRIRSVFAGLYSLDLGNEGDQAQAMAFADPDQFVLKPQREGGGKEMGKMSSHFN
ncbi:glutathione synthetase-like [Polypterus senegalus]|uniref:glutathione synthetase-like n=1 Tax=Polypterus senegalus TaxID=55291 RepID=UPI001966722D|nr:glutathione synthetase-like [Polypterus senegalus]